MRALPFALNMTIYQGATWRRSFRWLPAGTPADLTGWSGRMQIRADPPDAETENGDADPGDMLLELTTTNGGIALGADGVIALYATDTATATLPTYTSNRYDLELVNPGGEVTRWCMGRITVSPQVSQP